MVAIRKSIFDIESEYYELLQIIEESEGEITPEIAERLKINEEDLEKKLKAYSNLIKVKQSDNLAVDIEMSRLSKIKATNENSVKRLKDIILEAVKLYGYLGKSGNKKLDYDTVKFYTSSSKSVDVKPEFTDNRFIFNLIKNKLSHDETTYILDAAANKGINLATEASVDKTMIKEAINAGETVEHAEIKTTEFVVIK